MHGGGVPGQDQRGGVHLGDDRRARRPRRRPAARPGRRRPASARPPSTQIRGRAGPRRGRIAGAVLEQRIVRDAGARAGDGGARVDQLVVVLSSRNENSRSCSASNAAAERGQRAVRGRRSRPGRRRPGSRSPARGSARPPGRRWPARSRGHALRREPRPPRPSASSCRIPSSSPSVEVGEPAQAGAGRLVPHRWWSRRRSAHSTPGDGGTITGHAPVSLPSALACSGPAPPKATSAKSRGSKPCCTETSRSAAEHVLVDDVDDARPRPPPRLPGPSRRRSSAPRPGRPRASSVISPPASDGGQVAEHHVGVGDGRLGAALAVRGRAGHRPRPTAGRPAAPGSARARARSSRRPRPTVRTSTEEARTVRSPTLVSRPIRGGRSCTSATSVEVPPMSKVRRSR